MSDCEQEHKSEHSQADKQMSPRGTRRRQLKALWTAAEDRVLFEVVQKYGTKWEHVAKMMRNRSGKQCRERWMHHVSPDVKKSAWTNQEDSLIMTLVDKVGRRWAYISSQLPGRTDNAVKNRYHMFMRRGWLPELAPSSPSQPKQQQQQQPQQQQHESHHQQDHDHSDADDTSTTSTADALSSTPSKSNQYFRPKTNQLAVLAPTHSHASPPSLTKKHKTHRARMSAPQQQQQQQRRKRKRAQSKVLALTASSDSGMSSSEGDSDSDHHDDDGDGQPQPRSQRTQQQHQQQQQQPKQHSRSQQRDGAGSHDDVDVNHDKQHHDASAQQLQQRREQQHQQLEKQGQHTQQSQLLSQQPNIPQPVVVVVNKIQQGEKPASDGKQSQASERLGVECGDGYGDGDDDDQGKQMSSLRASSIHSSPPPSHPPPSQQQQQQQKQQEVQQQVKHAAKRRKIHHQATGGMTPKGVHNASVGVATTKSKCHTGRPKLKVSNTCTFNSTNTHELEGENMQQHHHNSHCSGGSGTRNCNNQGSGSFAGAHETSHAHVHASGDGDLDDENDGVATLAQLQQQREREQQQQQREQQQQQLQQQQKRVQEQHSITSSPLPSATSQAGHTVHQYSSSSTIQQHQQRQEHQVGFHMRVSSLVCSPLSPASAPLLPPSVISPPPPPQQQQPQQGQYWHQLELPHHQPTPHSLDSPPPGGSDATKTITPPVKAKHASLVSSAQISPAAKRISSSATTTTTAPATCGAQVAQASTVSFGLPCSSLTTPPRATASRKHQQYHQEQQQQQHTQAVTVTASVPVCLPSCSQLVMMASFGRTPLPSFDEDLAWLRSITNLQ